MLGSSIYATIASDENSLHDAYAEGGLAPGRSRAGKEFTRLASRIVGVEKKKSRMKISFLSA